MSVRPVGPQPCLRSTLAHLLMALFCGACATHLPLPDLASLYDGAARRHEVWRNPVVVIPGLMGSRLVDTEGGGVIWGAFDGGSVDVASARGSRLFALPMKQDATLGELVDGVVSDGALDRVRLLWLGLPFELEAYAHILAVLGVGGYRDEALGRTGAVDYGDDHFTCFQFDYDWRRDIPENARRLGEFLREKRAYVNEQYALRGVAVEKPVRFDVVAHSMGGLLLRWYLRYGGDEPDAQGAPPKLSWQGAEFIERAVLVGTPNLGSMNALTHLAKGWDPGWFLPEYPPAVLGTFPSLYQLLPRGRHGVLQDADGRPLDDLFDPGLWERNELGLADPRQDKVLRRLLPEVASPMERRSIALDHQAKCLRRARAVCAALDVPATPPSQTQLFLVAGDAVKTAQVARLRRSGARLEVTGTGPGDGTVLRASALGDERLGLDASDEAWEPRLVSPIAWRQVLLLFSGHLELTRDPHFTDNVLYLLLEDPREGSAGAE